MITYTKLWLLLNEKGMKRTDLKSVISSTTLAKLGKNEPISSTVIEKICNFLDCQPGDIMENVTKEDVVKVGQIWNKTIYDSLELLTTVTGLSKETLLEQFKNEMPSFIEKLQNGDTDIVGLSALNDENEEQE